MIRDGDLDDIAAYLTLRLHKLLEGVDDAEIMLIKHLLAKVESAKRGYPNRATA